MMLQMDGASGFEEIGLRAAESANDHEKVVQEEPSLLSVVGFVGFGFVVLLAIIKIIAEPFVAMFTYPGENDALPGMASAFGLVFAVFWFICTSILLSGIVFKVCYRFLKGL
jgi:hypothetical protein